MCWSIFGDLLFRLSMAVIVMARLQHQCNRMENAGPQFLWFYHERLRRRMRERERESRSLHGCTQLVVLGLYSLIRRLRSTQTAHTRHLKFITFNLRHHCGGSFSILFSFFFLSFIITYYYYSHCVVCLALVHCCTVSGWALWSMVCNVRCLFYVSLL